MVSRDRSDTRDKPGGMFAVACPACDKSLAVAAREAGRRGRCPCCGAGFLLPPLPPAASGRPAPAGANLAAPQPAAAAPASRDQRPPAVPAMQWAAAAAPQPAASVATPEPPAVEAVVQTSVQTASGPHPPSVVEPVAALPPPAATPAPVAEDGPDAAAAPTWPLAADSLPTFEIPSDLGIGSAAPGGTVDPAIGIGAGADGETAARDRRDRDRHRARRSLLMLIVGSVILLGIVFAFTGFGGRR